MLTQEELKELFIYNKETGIFIFKKTRGSRAIKGNVAGYKRPDDYILYASTR